MPGVLLYAAAVTEIWTQLRTQLRTQASPSSSPSPSGRSKASSADVVLPHSAPRPVVRLIEHLGSGVARLLARIEVPQAPEGFELRGDLPLVLIGNHRSLFDVLLGMRMMRRWNAPGRLMVKGDFFDRPGLGLLLRTLGAIPVVQGRGAKLAFDQAALALRNRQSIIIMPEARIVPPHERLEGTGELVSTLGRLVSSGPCMVVVTAMIGADDVWPVGASKPVIRPWRRPTVRIRSIAIRDLHELPHRDITARLQLEMRAILKRMESLGGRESEVLIEHA